MLINIFPQISFSAFFGLMLNKKKVPLYLSILPITPGWRSGILLQLPVTATFGEAGWGGVFQELIIFSPTV